MQSLATRLPTVLLLLFLHRGCEASSFPLIEASGVDPFAAGGWSLLVAGEHLCGPNASGAVLFHIDTAFRLCVHCPSSL